MNGWGDGTSGVKELRGYNEPIKNGGRGGRRDVHVCTFNRGCGCIGVGLDQFGIGYEIFRDLAVWNHWKWYEEI